MTEENTDTMQLTRLVRIFPNKATRKIIDRNIVYRNQLWNRALNKWEYLHRESKKHIIAYDFIPKTHTIKRKGKKPKIVLDGMKVRHRYERVISRIVFKPHQLKVNNDVITKSKPTFHYSFRAPSARVVREFLRDERNEKELIYPSSLLDQTVAQLGKAFDAFFDPKRPDAGYPKKKRTDIKKLVKGSYIDQEIKLRDSRHLQLSSGRKDPLKRLNKPIRTAEPIDAAGFNPKRMRAVIIKRENQYWAAITEKRPLKSLPATHRLNGVDANVSHYDSFDGRQNIPLKRLNFLYNRVANYQRSLAKKRIMAKIRHKRLNHFLKLKGLATKKLEVADWSSHKYLKVKAKLRRDYRKISNRQHDFIQKYTLALIKKSDTIFIEDLNVKAVAMSHITSKGVHRALFGYFKQVMQYKCALWRRKLVLVDQLYPSTQLCPYCGIAKAGAERVTLWGNQKHDTKHNEFICYNPKCPMYNRVQDRDGKVPLALVLYPKANMAYIKKAQKDSQIKERGWYQAINLDI